MILKKILPLLLILLVFGCNSEPKAIVDQNDYMAYISETPEENELYSKSEFWSDKLQKSKDNFVYLVQRANKYNEIFSATADVTYLKKAEEDLLLANEKTNYSEASILRSLAANYISQHRFKEALGLLQKAESNGERLNATKKMLFDVYLELGNYIYAEAYLNKIKNSSDFDYLIRLAKWEDHKGNLEGAIMNMEKAMAIAEDSNLKNLKQWSYTNIADFYGHAGEIEKSYQYYLKALELNPSDAYAKKGIAWILFSFENKPDEALDILESVSSYYDSPDYDLLVADIAEYKNDVKLKSNALKDYKQHMKNKHYGEMYNKYNVALYAEEFSQPETALEIAEREVENRPTPQSYDLLAWSHFKNGNIKKANEIVENYVEGKTFEPEVLYHIAEIYKAVGKTENVKPLKEELLGSLYELGPNMTNKIKQL